MLTETLKVFSMDGKVVIITGGAGFLGMQYGKALKEARADVILWDKMSALERLNFLLGGNYFNDVDVTDESSISRGVRDVIEQFGHIDVLINNAAMNPAVGSEEIEKMFAPYEDYSSELWDKEIAVDLTGAHLCTQAVAPYMMKQRAGVIVNVSSAVANTAVDNRIYGKGKFKSIAYITAKTGMLGLTRAWASYLGKYNVRVNAFSPGGMPKAEVPADFRERYSSLNMLGRMAEIDEYNGAILFLCSNASSFMTGSQLVMDGGISSC